MIKNEWKSLLRNKLMLIVVIAIIVIPIIYAGLFLKSMWDPYGNVDSLPVAVVNEDKPVEYNGKTLSIGKDMTDELKDNDSMAFNIVDSKTAEDGLANGTYYMVIKLYYQTKWSYPMRQTLEPTISPPSSVKQQC